MVGVREQLEVLEQLQALDQDMDVLDQKKQHLLRQIETNQQRLKEQEAASAQKRKMLEDLQRLRRQDEIEAEAKSQELKKLQARLYEVKTNKEYQAMQVEISTIKDDREKREELVLTKLVKEDDVRSELTELEQAAALLVKDVQQAEQSCRKELETIEAAAAVKETERSGITAQLDAQVLATYEKIRKNKAGMALAGIQDSNCSACHMAIRPQLLIEVRKHKELILCDSCSRILSDL